jgi:glutathione S-transferase
MTLKLYYHPFASACWKVLIALYEKETPFQGRVIDLGNLDERAELAALWPMVKFPVLVDEARGHVVPETSIIIEYLDQYHPGARPLLPHDRDALRLTRLRDRFYDFYVHDPMQRIVADRLRSKDTRDAHGVAQARAALENAYTIIQRDLQDSRWAAGDAFTLADCAAAPALYYANRVAPISDKHTHVLAYLTRLQERASFARVLREAEPYAAFFPE